MNKKELADKVLELEGEPGDTATFFSSVSADQTQFMLCLCSARKMTTEDILQALDVFVLECAENQTDLLDGSMINGNSQ